MTCRTERRAREVRAQAAGEGPKGMPEEGTA
jgi:hypothetical protein